MKYLMLLILVFSLAGSMSAQSAKKVIYTCVMHPEIKTEKPGNCPKCGMALIKKTVVATAPKSPVKKAVVPVTKPDQQGNAKQIDNDTAIQHTGMKEQPTDADNYTCPMHPDIQSAAPGNCPKCGMKLVKEEAMEMPADTGKHPGHTMDNMDRDTGMKINGIDDTMTKMPTAKAKLGPVTTITGSMPPRTVRYDLYVKDTTVSFGKKSKRAIAVNGQIPMPTLTFTEGDTAEIYVHNMLDEETSLHWHGLFLPNRMDGVPFMTQMPIKPQAVYLYKFPIVQHGTHWYHSHTKLQEQIGMYGAFIINKRSEWDIPTIPVVLSEWTDMKPGEVHRSLRSATDWFAIQKKATQSFSEAIQSGHFKTKITNEWKRMNAMDVSDVFYDNFLINGKNSIEYASPVSPVDGSGVRPFKAGDKVRLRIANAGASDYFWLKYAGGKITVVATDGNEVEPVEVDRLIIAVSETYDVVVTIPENKSYEFLVTPEDRTKSASLWLGSGEKVYAGKMGRLKYFAGMQMMNDMMDMQGNMVEMEGMKMQNQVMDMNTVMYPEITGEDKAGSPVDTATAAMEENMDDHAMHNMPGMEMKEGSSDIKTLNYAMLRAPKKTTLPDGPWRELKFDLTGNMNRYVWSMDNKVMSESDKILVKKGEKLRIILYNNSMMRHPMHLHGHDFRVLNGQGEYAPLKNVIDIMPMEKDTIEFYAGEAGGDWFFHCHILYHMMSGMGRVISYENTPANPELPDPKAAMRGLNADDKMFHPMGRIGLESNGSDGEFMLSQTRWRLSTLWHLGYHDMHGYESETMLGRYLGRMQWWLPYVGFDYHYKMDGGPKNIFGKEDKNWFGQKSNKLNRHTIVAGVAYTLPTLTVADFRIDLQGKLRFQLSREDIPVTPRLRFSWMLNTDKEYMAGFRYIVTKYLSLSTHYDSDMGLGAGVTITY